ncbi:MAG: hypothetical protein SF182_25425 [Deltaproteobacteria bacterium]|nr:hypothetical protein [Deltaproteobacteria bacterium]
MLGSNLAFAAPDLITSALEPLVPGRTARPAERLMLAVFEQARADLALPHGAVARQDARRWMQSDDDEWPLAFVRICRHFGIDPDAARAALLG